jgi:TM2 domain-containing membrane protein YozV
MSEGGVIMFCRQCGGQMPDGSKFCAACGAAVEGSAVPPQQAQQPPPYARPVYVANVSPKSRLAALLLCWFVGVLGVHRFYVGKVGTGFLWLFTLGLFGIGALVDFIMIIVGSFTDKQGCFVKNWLD